uniref:Exonuclease XPMC2 n=1 Tax=Leptobrachium leishanense TaxID=445787 RepID=A0A8C5MFP7_9ANUR
MKDSASGNLFYGFSVSGQYMTAPHVAVSSDPSQSEFVRNRRKSRRCERFLKRKEVLKQRQHLSMSESHYRESSGKNTPCDPSGTDQFSCFQRLERKSNKVADLQSEGLGDINITSRALPGKSACSTDLAFSDTESDSGLSMAGSCVSSRPVSPTWLKPGKCVAVDCEMVGTGPGGRIGELARCSLVNYAGDVMYDKYVHPELPITDYRTRWSGITKHHMKQAIPFKTAQKEILNLLKDKRVVGHALHNDFKALKYFHPVAQTRDTSKIPLLNKKAGLPAKRNVSLKCLASCLLNKTIQENRKGHSSVEDAQTSMELYKLVEDKWEHKLHSCSESYVMDNNNYMEDRFWPPDLEED